MRVEKDTLELFATLVGSNDRVRLCNRQQRLNYLYWTILWSMFPCNFFMFLGFLQFSTPMVLDPISTGSRRLQTRRKIGSGFGVLGMSEEGTYGQQRKSAIIQSNTFGWFTRKTKSKLISESLLKGTSSSRVTAGFLPGNKTPEVEKFLVESLLLG